MLRVRISHVIIAMLAIGLSIGCQSPKQEAITKPKLALPQIVVEDIKESTDVNESLQSQKLRPAVQFRPPKKRQAKNPFARSNGTLSRETPPSEPKVTPDPKPIVAQTEKTKTKSEPPVTKELSLGGERPYPTTEPQRLPDPDERENADSANPDIEAAQPIHHPGITIFDEVDLPWIDCCFDLKADGTFNVYLITDIRDPILKEIAMRTLSRWKWKPRMNKGVPVPSREFIRLRRNVTRQPYPNPLAR